MKKHWLFLILFISHLGISQCQDIGKLELGGDYGSKSNNYIPFEVKYADSIYHEDISYPIDIQKIGTYSNFIFETAKDYIVSRANIDFYNRLELYRVEVNYPLSIPITTYEDDSLYDLSKYEVTYWIIYTYKKDKCKYAFGLEFNKRGKLISEDKFPEYLKNPMFEKLTDPCDALHLVQLNKKFKNKQVDYIELAYLDESNSFCWLVKEKMKINKRGVSKYDLELYYVNANTNRLETVKKVTGTVISCGYQF